LGAWSIGPGLIFGRLWDRLKLPAILKALSDGRKFSFEVERAIFATVLHRLFEAGSDRQAARWMTGMLVPGAEEIRLHHLHRAMRWLGQVKDGIEDGLFAHHRDLFTELSLVFFDTTSLHFEGRGGETLGQLGHSKDRRGDHHQVVAGALLTQTGRPISCDIAPGNQTDVTALLPMVDRARERFGLSRVCWVADRGMCSKGIIEGLEQRQMEYILGVRMRALKEVGDRVLTRPGRYRDVDANLKVKEVWVDDRRYVLCYNPEEAAKDRADRQAILEALEEELQRNPRALVSNRGYRRFVRIDGQAISINEDRVAEEERFDGKFVLRTNTNLPAEEVALRYKDLWMVEAFFRAAKSLLETRPVFHKYDDTIRGHIFASFLALLLRHELMTSLASFGQTPEWADIVRDLAALQEVEVAQDGSNYRLRLPLQGVCGKVFQAVGVAVPSPVRPV
jgi:hypothetical protein